MLGAEEAIIFRNWSLSEHDIGLIAWSPDAEFPRRMTRTEGSVRTASRVTNACKTKVVRLISKRVFSYMASTVFVLL